jgi:transcriptional regulator GlxA family with amidase domain
MQDGAVNDKRVIEVLALISSRYRQPLTRDVLARHVNLSPSRLHSLFRRQLNTTPRALIMAKRMETAAELLRTTHLLVKEVAARVGIQDDSHFVRDFAKVYGLSPTAYRQSHTARRTVHFVRDSAQSVQSVGQMANR